MTSSSSQTAVPTTVFVIVHELFAIHVAKDRITLLPPVVPPCKDKHGNPHYHKYVVSRFKGGMWDQNDYLMSQGGEYSIQGLRTGNGAVPDHREFNPCPKGAFQLQKSAYCAWVLPIPKQVHQLRLIDIPYTSRPIFIGDPHGNAVNAELKAISIAQALEYKADPNLPMFISERTSGPVKLDYSPDNSIPSVPTVNLHLWAQLEDESDIEDSDADMHANEATHAASSLFRGLNLEGGKVSLSVDSLFQVQLPTPLGIRFPEMMTLAERHQMQSSRGVVTVMCSARTCGNGGNLFVTAP